MMRRGGLRKGAGSTPMVAVRCIPSLGHCWTQRRTFVPGMDIASLIGSPAGMMALMYRPNSKAKGTDGEEKENKEKDKNKEDRDPKKENKNKEEEDKKKAGEEGGNHFGDNFGSAAGLGAAAPSWIPKDGLAIAAAILIVTTVWEILKTQQAKVSRWMGEYFYTTLEVRSHQEEFDMVMHWVSTQELSQKTKNLGFHTTHVMEDDELIVEDLNVAKKGDADAGSSAPSSTSLSVDFLRVGSENSPTAKHTRLVPGYGTHVLRYKGKKMYITRDLDSEQPQSAKGGDTFGRRMPAEVITITCFSTNRSIVEELIEDVKQSRKEKDARSTPIYLKGQYGADWDLLCRRPKRPLDTLYLPGSVTMIVPEIENFLRVREDYGKVGVPWRRGYLLTGPPGTGKSSLIMAIAGKFNLPLYNLSLRGGGEGSGGMSDTDLLKLVNSVPPRSILLIEDMDTILEDIGGNSPCTSMTAAAQDEEEDTASSSQSWWQWLSRGGTTREGSSSDLSPQQDIAALSSAGPSSSSGSGVSMSGLLNALDGVACSEGRILFITANDPKKFRNKDVLLRPGRIDRTVEFDKMQAQQYRAMMAKYRQSLPNIPAALALELKGENALLEGEEDLGTTAAQLQGRLLDHLLAPTPEQVEKAEG